MTGTGPSAQTARRWPRWKGVLLVASLAVNLLVAGLVATAAIRHGLRPPFSASQATVLNFARTLPPERRREIWQSTREQRRALRPFWIELRRARADARAALTAEPFDPTRYKAAHTRLLEAEIAVRRGANGLFETVATRLTVTERRAFAEWQEQVEHRARRRRDAGREGRDGDPDDEGHSEGGASPAAPAAPASAASPAGR
ncbi:MAG: periplasmic heavy metal sensor [Hyphomicrobiaceae bacterium]